LSFAIGKDIGGQHIFARLENMPHLLVAGATGSGKSACVNSIICSLLYRATPREVRFLMIDPKRVELTMYNAIPHLKSPVITDAQQAAMALKLLVKEMEDRYKLFATAGVRDIAAFNRQAAQTREAGAPDTPPHMPYIIVFIDEFADLMMVSANEVENAVTRLAQMARGVGIHLVLATQRPSVDVITGVIKANFPSRIAFQVSSKVDSRTILDANGADALLGRGDMLYSPASSSKPLRVQGVFVTTPEVERIAAFWKEQGAPVFDPAFSDSKLKSGGNAEGEVGEADELFSEAVSWVVRAKQASTSLLQRRLKIGYSRAARLLDLMEERGVVGPPEGSKPRKVLVSTDDAGQRDDDLPEGPNV
ncbi:MAG: DNA translocase FtsK, partial [Candidatus Firestonebacteria bacterium]|nr:DNA translocase FtsK [Candidatus Firestonebacteria bacterium]